MDDLKLNEDFLNFLKIFKNSRRSKKITNINTTRIMIKRSEHYVPSLEEFVDFYQLLEKHNIGEVTQNDGTFNFIWKNNWSNRKVYEYFFNEPSEIVIKSPNNKQAIDYNFPLRTNFLFKTQLPKDFNIDDLKRLNNYLNTLILTN